MIAWVIPDLDLANLSLWLFELYEVPIALSFRAAISTIPQNKLVRNSGSFIDSDKVVVEVELVDDWKVSVLMAIDWQVRI